MQVNETNRMKLNKAFEPIMFQMPEFKTNVIVCLRHTGKINHIKLEREARKK